MIRIECGSPFFFFNDPATTEIYTLSLHDALPISSIAGCNGDDLMANAVFSMERTAIRETWVNGEPLRLDFEGALPGFRAARSEEHTSELQSRLHLVCRLLLEKKKDIITQARPALG